MHRHFLLSDGQAVAIELFTYSCPLGCFQHPVGRPWRVQPSAAYCYPTCVKHQWTRHDRINKSAHVFLFLFPSLKAVGIWYCSEEDSRFVTTRGQRRHLQPKMTRWSASCHELGARGRFTPVSFPPFFFLCPLFLNKERERKNRYIIHTEQQSGIFIFSAATNKLRNLLPVERARIIYKDVLWYTSQYVCTSMIQEQKRPVTVSDWIFPLTRFYIPPPPPFILIIWPGLYTSVYNSQERVHAARRAG